MFIYIVMSDIREPLKEKMRKMEKKLIYQLEVYSR